MSKLRVLDLFSGIGGFSLGLERTGGFTTKAFCEIDPYCRAVLETQWPGVKVYEDVRDVTRAQLRSDGANCNFIVGGFPCQDASIANIGGEGTSGDRTGLFREITRLAGDLQPDGVLMENVTNLLNRGFGDVLSALAEVGFDAEWECFPACDVGADHERDRLFILAYPKCEGRKGSQPLRGALGRAKAALSFSHDPLIADWRPMVRDSFGVRSGDGLSLAMERRRLHALGNAIVPQIPELIGRSILASNKKLWRIAA